MNETMLNDNKMVIIHIDKHYGYEGIDEVDTHVEEITSNDRMVEILGENIDWGAILPDLLKNKHFVESLSSEGFVNSATIKKICDNAELTGKFFYYDTKDRYSLSLTEINLDVPSHPDVEALAFSTAHLLAAINKSSLKSVAPVAYKKMQAAKKKMEVAAKKRAEAKKTIAAKKKQKDIEAAKKLLEQEGEKL